MLDFLFKTTIAKKVFLSINWLRNRRTFKYG